MAKSKTKTAGKSSLPLWVKYTLWALAVLFLVAYSYENRRIFRKAYRFITKSYYKKSFKPSDFPEDYTIHGIDISHYQVFVDWDKLKAVDTYGDTIHFKFVIVKATEGLLIEDDMFDEHWENAGKNGYVRGAYHYFLPDRSPKVQAANFITSVKLLPGDLPPIIDIEETRKKSKKEVVAALKEFIAEVEQHYKVKPIIYSNINFIEDYLMDSFPDYFFWIAHYYRDELSVDDKLNWVFWQHSDKANLLGFRVNVDANVFNGNEDDFRKLLIPDKIQTE
ncbi:MAG: glycoside hydrolase family 25 protein [Chitinophagales bacterium]|nr:glycoside hydrolase family 25 protein [Chitinophagales bacterium]